MMVVLKEHHAYITLLPLWVLFKEREGTGG